MDTVRHCSRGGLLLALRNDIDANTDCSDWQLWFKYGAQAALLHVQQALEAGAEPQTVLDDLYKNILTLQADRAERPGSEFDIWPINDGERQRYEG
jgi:hypothetical protein